MEILWKSRKGYAHAGRWYSRFRSNLSKNFNFGGPTPLSLHRWGWNLAWRRGSLLHAKFHPNRCNVSLLRSEKPQNRPVSKLNTGRFALRAMLPVITKSLTILNMRWKFRGLGTHLTQSPLGWDLPPYQLASWCIQPFGHNRSGPKIGEGPIGPFLWSPYEIGRPYIYFHPAYSFFFFLLSFFSSPNLSSRRLDVYHTLAHGVALVRI